MFRVVLVCLLLVGIFAFCLIPVQTRQFDEDCPDTLKLLALCSAGSDALVIDSYTQLPSDLKHERHNCYLTGCAYMRRHEFSKAKPLLYSAVESGFLGYPGWESAEELLGRIKSIERLCPPLLHNYSLGNSSSTVFAYNTPWVGSICLEMPKFLERAKIAFGDPVPLISFYFFKQRSDFNQFYTNVFNYKRGRAWQNGTGSFNVVLFCERDRTEHIVGEAIPNWNIGCVMHEYCHALCGTIYGDAYYRKVPQWFDEGLADAFARKYLTYTYSTSDITLKKIAREKRPPSYDTLCHAMYDDDPDLAYTLARLMVAQIIPDNRIDTAGRILKKAKENDGNFELAIEQITGSKPRTLYNNVIHSYWKY